MELTELKGRIFDLFQGTEEEKQRLLDQFENDKSVFPFNEFEHLICSLLDLNGITFKDYDELRQEYIGKNPNLWIFEITAPRGFGEKFAQTYVKGLCPDFKNPNKSLDKNFDGSYDFWMDGIRIEVKASRVTDKSRPDEPLYLKALSENTTASYDMNFQQLKPQCCDVFVWLAVYRDSIKVWVMSSDEVANHKDFSKGQHRGNHGNEGQLHLTDNNISTFAEFELRKDESLKNAVTNAYQRRFNSQLN